MITVSVANTKVVALQNTSSHVFLMVLPLFTIRISYMQQVKAQQNTLCVQWKCTSVLAHYAILQILIENENDKKSRKKQNKTKTGKT